jgi:hypothetical protein
MKKTTLLSLFTALAAGLAVSIAQATPFTAGNLVIYTTSPTSSSDNSASAVTLREYQTNGTFVQAVPVPSTGTSSLTATANATTEGNLSTSANGFLVITGYRADAGTAAVSGSTVPRVVGVVDSTGAVDTSTTLTAYSGLQVRGVASDDGTHFWVTGANGSGSNGGIQYVSLLGASSSILLGSASNNTRASAIFNNQLYVTAGANTPGRSVSSVSSGAPPTAPPTTNTSITVTNLFPSVATNAYEGFLFLDRDASVAGLDTLYAMNIMVGSIDKFSFDGTSWTARGSIALAAVGGVTGVVDGANADLFVTTATSTGGVLDALVDTAAFNANISGSLVNLATATSTQAFRGVAFVPTATAVPEPSTIVLGGLGVIGLIGFARRRKNG